MYATEFLEMVRAELLHQQEAWESVRRAPLKLETAADNATRCRALAQRVQDVLQDLKENDF